MNNFTDVFKEYLERVNGACDAEEESYDAAILFVGREDFADKGGMALVGGVCGTHPAIVVSTTLTNGQVSTILGKLTAHEVGHLLGALHDGDSGSHIQMLDGPYKGIYCIVFHSYISSFSRSR